MSARRVTISPRPMGNLLHLVLDFGGVRRSYVFLRGSAPTGIMKSRPQGYSYAVDISHPAHDLAYTHRANTPLVQSDWALLQRTHWTPSPKEWVLPALPQWVHCTRPPKDLLEAALEDPLDAAPKRIH